MTEILESTFTSTKGSSLPELKPDLPRPTAHDVWMGAGFEAVAGFPLPNGCLPVGCAALGVVQMTPAAWEEYRAICDGERRALEVRS